jgi:hypothetical protein
MYKPKDRILRVKALEQFLGWKMKPGQRLLAAVNKVRHLAARIPKLGGDIQLEDTLIVTLLRGLCQPIKPSSKLL